MFSYFEIFLLIPSSGCLTIKTSGLIELIVVIVSSKVSPLFIELSFKATFIRSAPKRFAATSKLVLVLVESSKNKLKTLLINNNLKKCYGTILEIINSKRNNIDYDYKVTDIKSKVSNLADKLIITIAAGIRMPKYRTYLGDDITIIRVMPNTPSLVGQGMSGLVTDSADDKDKAYVTDVFDGVGDTLWVADEDQLDILGAVAGSGPAYFFEFMDSLAKGAMELGFEKARAMVQQTCLGAAQMAKESDLTLEDLRKQVTSKGGSTAKGVEVYQQRDLHNISADAVKAAVKRNQEMADLF